MKRHISKIQLCIKFVTCTMIFPFSKCNIFANIPNHKLLAAQQKVHRIREKPVFHLLNSLTKLKPEKGFYPMLDIERLYQILTTEQSLTLAHPSLFGGVVDQQQQQMEPHYKATEKKGDRCRRTELIKAVMGEQVPGADETAETRKGSRGSSENAR